MAAATGARGCIGWTETGAGPDGRKRSRWRRLPAAMGRRRAGAQGDADELSPLRSSSTMRCQGVTHVVRGQDLFWSTSVHRLLQALLGLPVPTYHHHRLVLDADGRKLSKSTQRDGVAQLCGRSGATPARYPADGGPSR